MCLLQESAITENKHNGTNFPKIVENSVTWIHIDTSKELKSTPTLFIWACWLCCVALLRFVVLNEHIVRGTVLFPGCQILTRWISGTVQRSTFVTHFIFKPCTLLHWLYLVVWRQECDRGALLLLCLLTNGKPTLMVHIFTFWVCVWCGFICGKTRVTL